VARPRAPFSRSCLSGLQRPGAVTGRAQKNPAIFCAAQRTLDGEDRCERSRARKGGGAHCCRRPPRHSAPYRALGRSARRRDSAGVPPRPRGVNAVGARGIACATASGSKERRAAAAGGRTGARGEPPGPLQERRWRRQAHQRGAGEGSLPPGDSLKWGCRRERGPGGENPAGAGGDAALQRCRRPTQFSAAGDPRRSNATEWTAALHVVTPRPQSSRRSDQCWV
jgi:hypothetical protein